MAVTLTQGAKQAGHLPQRCSHVAQAITDMVIANESRVAKSRVVTTFNKARQVLFNLAIRCPHKAASLHTPKRTLQLFLIDPEEWHIAMQAPPSTWRASLAVRRTCCLFQAKHVQSAVLLMCFREVAHAALRGSSACNSRTPGREHLCIPAT